MARHNPPQSTRLVLLSDLNGNINPCHIIKYISQLLWLSFNKQLTAVENFFFIFLVFLIKYSNKNFRLLNNFFIFAVTIISKCM